MKLGFLILGSFLSALCCNPRFASAHDLQAAFIRDANLWVKTNGREQQITRDRSVSSPRLSYDGEWLAYCVTADPEFHHLNTLRVRNLKTSQDTMVSAFQKDAYPSVAWSPNRDILAFQNETILNDINMDNVREQGFRNVSLGVSQFAWLPDGSGFLVSSSAHLLPNGWTHARLYTISLQQGRTLINTAVPFYTLPKEVSVSDTKVWVIGTSTFKWSADGKWIAFIVHPTASWSMDSDVLCVLSVKEKRLIPVAEMINRENWFEWAAHSPRLAFIQGGGRFITEGKRLGLASAPAFHQQDGFTPSGFVDNALTWDSETSLTVSRAKEGDYRAKLPPEQLPSLYRVQLQDKSTQRISTPPLGFGDYQPMWHAKSQNLLWVRASDTTSSLWLSDVNRLKQIPWIANIQREPWTVYWSMWHRTLHIR